MTSWLTAYQWRLGSLGRSLIFLLTAMTCLQHQQVSAVPPTAPAGRLSYAALTEMAVRFEKDTGLTGGLFARGPSETAPVNPNLEEYVAWMQERRPKAQYLMIDCERHPPDHPAAIEIAKRVAKVADRPIGWYDPVGLGTWRRKLWREKTSRRLAEVGKLPIDAVFAELYVRWPGDNPGEFEHRCKTKMALAKQASGKAVVALASPGFHASHPQANELIPATYSQALFRVASDAESWAVWVHPSTTKKLETATEEQQADVAWMLSDRRK